MAQISRIMFATLSLTPGTEVIRAIDLPHDVTDGPNFYLSKAAPSDPANSLLFKWRQLTGAPATARDLFVGAEQFGVLYDLSGTSNIDVDFVFVWTDEVVNPLGYWEYD